MRRLSTKIRRRGVTLTEALIAVGIMSVGLLALLTFFPLAAVQMARSFKDDRTATLAANADNLYRAYWRELWTDPNDYSKINPEFSVAANEPGLQALDDPWVDFGSFNSLPNLSLPGGSLLTSNKKPYGLYDNYPGPPYQDGKGTDAPTTYQSWFSNAYPSTVRNNTTWPSFPVMMDPIGFRTHLQDFNDQHWVANFNSAIDLGTNKQFFLARRTMQSQINASGTQGASRFCTLLDDITFDETGLPGSVVDRAGKYNCAWIVQRSRNVTRLSIDITVLTFQGRPNSDVAGQEHVAAISNGNTVDSTSLTVNFAGGSDLPVRRGEWIIGVDMSNPNDANFPAVPDSRRFLTFHRVLSVNDNGGGSFTLELQQPIPKAQNNGVPTHILMLEGLVEVFEAGRITLKTPPKP